MDKIVYTPSPGRPSRNALGLILNFGMPFADIIGIDQRTTRQSARISLKRWEAEYRRKEDIL